jgi:small ligand-binding sensory domain FIST
MPFSAALSTEPDTRKGIDEISSGAVAALQGPPDLALLFFSPHHVGEVARQAGDFRKRLGTSCLLGCSGESIVGNEQEIEQRPALSLWLARWTSPVQIEPFRIAFEQAPSANQLAGLPDSVAAADPRQSAILLLGDPFSFGVNPFLTQLHERSPGLRVMGGLASGGKGPGECKLLLGDTMLDRGAVGVLLSGPIGVRSLVSQGCRPIGKPLVVTRAQDNVILELDGRAPMVHLQQLYRELGPRDQQLFQRGLHIQWGIPDGSFLVRNTLGIDRGSGALTINDNVRIGQSVQFCVRDADSADEELHALLRRELRVQEPKPGGALLFTCNRRGSRMFSQPHHDAGVVRAEAGPIPVAGFFAEGEIGPIGGQNFCHGFTASVVLFAD